MFSTPFARYILLVTAIICISEGWIKTGWWSVVEYIVGIIALLIYINVTEVK